MNLKEFLAEALLPRPGERAGQRFFNVLARCRPKLAATLTEGDAAEYRDPYYRDENLWAAVHFVVENWNDE